MEKKISIKQAIGYGWKKFWPRWKFYVGIILGTLAVSWVFSLISGIFRDQALVSFLMSIIGFIIQILISIGLITIFIKSAREKDVSWNDMLVNKGRFLKFFGVSILFQIIVVLGFVLLIVPGIYLALRYQYAYYAILDNPEISIGRAFKQSSHMTKDIKWKLFWFGMVSIGIALLGMLALGIGLFVAIPVLGLSQSFVYIHIRKTYHDDFLEKESAEGKVVEAEVEPVEITSESSKE